MVVVTLNWERPMLLLDLEHLCVLPELGQAAMANCTCCATAQVDYGQFALKTNYKGDWKRRPFHTASVMHG